MIETPNNHRVMLVPCDDHEDTVAKLIAELIHQSINFHITIEDGNYVFRFNGGF